jgi:hypothetical protein
MAQEFLLKPSVNFTKGLNTEAGELTFPEDASIDELNCDAFRDGSRRRRLAVEYEDDYELCDVIGEDDFVEIHKWDSVGGAAGITYTVVQYGGTLCFFTGNQSPVSDGQVHTTSVDRAISSDYSGASIPFTVDLTDFEIAGEDATVTAIEVTSVLGGLVVVGAAIEPFVLTRTGSSSFKETIITFKVRDFEWQGSTINYANDDPVPVNDLRSYDTRNAGWTGSKGGAALTAYIASEVAWPELTHPWYSGKDSSNNFSVSEWQKVFAGNSLTSNGHYIVDFFEKSRVFDSGTVVESEETRFKTVCDFAGRIFYAGLTSQKNGAKILFSRILEDLSEVGRCFQQFDPTSEDLSDVLDTDGGVIVIPEARNILKVFPYQASVLIFAENGVWEIFGVEDYFKATAFGVRKITETGLLNTHSFVSVDGNPMWWSAHGIHVISRDDRGVPTESNISSGTIQTYWDEIPGSSKQTSISQFDPIRQRVYWFWKTSGEALTSKYNEVLVFDLALQGWYPWTISDQDVTTSFIVGSTFFQGASYAFNGNSTVKLIVRDGVTGSITFAEFKGEDFLDWGNADYSSYLIGTYDFIGDMNTKKTSPYITVMFRVTEEGWTGNEDAGYSPIHPSSCLVSAFWDNRTTSAATAQQAYRLKSVPIIDVDNLSEFGYNSTTVFTRLKLRGRGRVVSLKFESEATKDFQLIGFEKVAAKNSNF